MNQFEIAVRPIRSRSQSGKKMRRSVISRRISQKDMRYLKDDICDSVCYDFENVHSTVRENIKYEVKNHEQICVVRRIDAPERECHGGKDS